MIEFEIDGQKVTAPEGSTIIEAADTAGIYIPRFCYHKHLSIAANCRMCLVEIEKMGKPQPACATPATAEMKVFTQSEKAMAAQRAVMQFLLINHPLDCPICDQGGECELQDLSVGYGYDKSIYDEPKRAVFSEDIGPLIETEMTRCIHCTRCVRFGDEVAGLRELGAVFRGEHMQIGTYVKHFLRSELSGNVIDLCPVGALTNKPARYKGRSWEYQEHPMIGAHDCVGTNLFVHTRARQYSDQRVVMRAVPRDNAAINETWMSDRDRFSVHGLYHEARVQKPRIKRQGQWVEVSWSAALREISAAMKAIHTSEGSDQFAAIASPSSTVEEFYLLQKLMRGLGSSHVDHRLDVQDSSDQSDCPMFPSLGMPIAEIESLNSVLIVGSDVRFDQPILGHWFNLATQGAAKVHAINPVDYTWTFPVDQKIIHADLVDGLARVAKAVVEAAGVSAPALDGVQPDETARHIAAHLRAGERSAIFLGVSALADAQAAQLRALSTLIATHTDATIGFLTPGANSAGGWIAGAIPHRGPAGQPAAATGQSAPSLLTDSAAEVFILLNVEPEFDVAYAASALKKLNAASMVICLTAFASPDMLVYADVILPVTPYTENTGTFVNVEGQWQSFRAVSPPLGESKPAWKVLRALGNFLSLEGFEFKTAHEVRAELKAMFDAQPSQMDVQTKLKAIQPAPAGLRRLATVPMYRVDGLVRRSAPLQACVDIEPWGVRLNSATAEKHAVQQGDQVVVSQSDATVTLPVQIDARVSDDTLWIPAGLAQTKGFGTTSGALQITRVREGA